MNVLNKRYDPAVPVSKLKTHELNPRQGDIGAICQSIAHNGFYGTLIVQESTGKILAGNHRFQSAVHEGATTVPVMYVACDDDAAKRILVSDNRANDLASYDSNALAELLDSIRSDQGDLTGTLYDQEDYDRLLSDLSNGYLGLNGAGKADKDDSDKVEGQTFEAPNAVVKTGNCDDDEAPEPEEKPTSQLGDVWICGEHRVMCGDSTDKGQVELLMDGQLADMVFTDPPYGIKVVGKNGKVGGDNLAKNGIYAPIIGDETTDTAVKVYRLCVELQIPVLILWGGNYFADKLPASACWVVWDKRGDMASNNFADCELAWTNQKSPARVYKQLWSGMIKEGESGKRVHPTQKPVNLAAWCFEQYCEKANRVLDLFLGSGSTLIACEKTGRSCFGMEMSPDYVDVIVKRWQTFTGQRATLENDGRTFDDVALARS